MKKALARTLFTACSVIFISVQAENTEMSDQLVSMEGNVIVNSRPLSKEKKALMEEQYKEEMMEAEEMIKNGSIDISQTSIPIKWKDHQSAFATKIPIKWKDDENRAELATTIIPIKYKELTALISGDYHATAANFSPYIYHWIESFPQGNIIKIEDGSEWVFNKDQADIVRDWRHGDAIVVMPKGGSIWDSNYAYTVTNKDLGTSVDVNLFLGPLAFGPYSTWLIGIDLNAGEIYLMNGQGERTVWEVYHKDLRYIKEDWVTNDTVFIGENTSWLWWFSSYNSIIVNVNMNHYVRVRQVSSTPNYAQGLRG